jgi:hypothetical protein
MGHPAQLLLRVALAGVTARALFQIAGYFLHRFDVRRHHLEASLMIMAALALAAVFTDREPKDRGAPPHRLSMWTVLIGTSIAAFVLYWPALGIGFLSDDFVLADRAARGEFVAASHEFVRPVPLLLWRLLFAIGGGSAAVHAVNVLLHGVNAALTARLAQHAGARQGPALIAALLFLIWPTQVESVTWASGVFDLLMTTFVLGLTHLYLAGVPEISSRRIVTIVLAAMLALLTKETAAAVPILLLALSAIRWRDKRPSRSELTAMAVVTLTCAAYMTWRVILRPSGLGSQQPTVTRYAVKELLSRTFGSLAVPFTADWSTAAPLVAVVFASAVVLLAVLPIVAPNRRLRLDGNAVAALIWPAIAAAPALGFLFIGANLEGSRYLYLPMAGWAIFLAMAADSAAALRRGMLPVAAVCGIALTGVCVRHSRSLLADWSEAAAHRDAVLADATKSLERGSCRSGHFAAAPESYKGAQLFKNGLDEAVRSVMAGRATPAGNAVSCEFVWDGAGFVRR